MTNKPVNHWLCAEDQEWAREARTISGDETHTLLRNTMDLYELFKELLDAEPYEEVIHRFLATHQEILRHYVSFRGACTVLSKVNIHRYELDFALQEKQPSSGTSEWTLVEIERSTHKLFNRNGDPSAALSHAIRQILDWRLWIEDNLAYARSIMPQIGPAPIGLVVIGRRSTLSESDKKRLGILVASLYRIKIRTYDHLLDICIPTGGESCIGS